MEKIDYLELVLNALKEHEKRLDEISTRLEHTKIYVGGEKP